MAQQNVKKEHCQWIEEAVKSANVLDSSIGEETRTEDTSVEHTCVGSFWNSVYNAKETTTWSIQV